MAEELGNIQESIEQRPEKPEVNLGSLQLPDPPKHYFWGTGRRKRSIARVRVKPGSGKFEVNGKGIENFFCLEKDRLYVSAPLRATQTQDKVDVFVSVKGGGVTGQAGAIVLGIARALQTANTEYEVPLRQAGHLTRDSRKVERKKYGKRGARRSFQFSKR